MRNDDSLRKLERQINERIKIAYDALLKNDKTTALENIEWVKTASIVIGKLKKKPNNIRAGIIVGLISVFLIGLGLTLKMPAMNVSIDIITKSVTLKLKKDWITSTRFSVSQLSISNLKEVSAPGANIKVTNSQPFDMELKGDNIVLDKFGLSSNSEITIQTENNNQAFLIKNDRLSTDVQVGKANLHINNAQVDTALNFEVPETFKIKSFPSVAIPISIMFTDTTDWRFRDMLISNITFLEESLPGSGKFVSSIVSGTLKILEIDKEIALEEGDWLLLENLANRRLEITKSNSELKIHVEGIIAKAKAGSELFEKELNPSILEYLYYTKFMAFFWSCVVFIFTLIWSIKNALFSNQH